MPLEFYSCKLCDKIFNGRRPYEDHIVSVNHQKKINQACMADTVVDASTRTTQGSSQPGSDPFIVPRGCGYWCSLCKLDLNGPEPMKAHIAGSKHLKLKSGHPLNSGGDIVNADLSNMKMSDSPKNMSDLYSDIEKTLTDVKVFDVADPIEF